MTEDHTPYTPDSTLTPTFTGEPGDLAKLFAKLTAAGSAVTPVEKNGTNDFHNYAYMTADDICAAVRDALYDQGVFLFVSILDTDRNPAGKTSQGTPKVMTRTWFQFTFVDTETGARAVMHWVGESFDNEDKGINKTATQALKYFLIKNLLIISGADVDPDAYGDPYPSQPAPDALPSPVRRTVRHHSVTPPGATEFWSKANMLVGDGKRFSGKDEVKVWLRDFTTEEGVTNWAEALAKL